jgi:Uma2 family endonuclease
MPPVHAHPWPMFQHCAGQQSAAPPAAPPPPVFVAPASGGWRKEFPQLARVAGRRKGNAAETWMLSLPPMIAASPASGARRLTLEAWTTLPDDEPGEWIDGWLVEEEVATPIHEAIVMLLGMVLRGWLGPRGLVGASNARFQVTPTRGRKPDLFVYLPHSRLPRGDAILIDAAPDILVEVVSARPSDQRRDRIEKLAEYARFGASFYWLVDPHLRSFEILQLGTDARYVHAVTASEGRIEDVPGCQGLTIDVDEIWREVERLDHP